MEVLKALQTRSKKTQEHMQAAKHSPASILKQISEALYSPPCPGGINVVLRGGTSAATQPLIPERHWEKLSNHLLQPALKTESSCSNSNGCCLGNLQRAKWGEEYLEKMKLIKRRTNQL